MGSDTTIATKHDTVQGKPILVRYTVEKPRWYKITDHDTLEIYNEVLIPPTDTLSELRRLQAIERLFKTPNTYIDTPRGNTWKVDAKLTVQNNELKATEYVVQTTDSVIKTTTVLKPPKPIVLSFVISHMANLNNAFYATGIGGSLRLPNDKEYTVQVFNVQGHKPMVMVTVGVALRNPFKKRK